MGNVSAVGYVVKTFGKTYNTNDILVTDNIFRYIKIDGGVVKFNYNGTHMVFIEDFDDQVGIMPLPANATLTDVINTLINQLKNCVLEEIEVIM